MVVVDQYRRVKGVQGLWVVNAPVMPRIPRSGGAHATVVMIGGTCRRLDRIKLTPPYCCRKYKVFQRYLSVGNSVVLTGLTSLASSGYGDHK
jgi:hypothetical protein